MYTEHMMTRVYRYRCVCVKDMMCFVVAAEGWAAGGEVGRID